MQTRLIPYTLSMFLFAMASTQSVAADETSDTYPILSNRFFVSAGVFLPDKNFKLNVRGSADASGRTIDFDEAFKTDTSESTGAAELRWRFGEKWQLQGQVWKVSDGGRSVLEKDVQWKDFILEAGSNASASFGIDVARVFMGRKFYSSDKSEFGAGFGFHWLELSASISGQIRTNLGDTEAYADSVSASAPLPNLGAWYIHALSPRWALTAHVDWLSASFDEYSGSILNTQLGVNWAFSKHFGAKATWNFFKLDVDVDKTGWIGEAEISQNGPFLSLYATW